MEKLNKKFRDSQGVTTQGTISVHPKGFAFVSPDDSKTFPEDIFIPKHLKGNAVDGDRVEIVISPDRKPDKGPEGWVSSILERAKQELVGVVWIIKSKGDYLLYIQSLGASKSALVKKTKKVEYKVGDRLLLKVIDWGDEKSPALCAVIEKLGTIEEAFTDIPAAIKDFGIRKDFPQGVLNQVEHFSRKVEKQDLEGRTDLTSLETFTIDPDTARDFDDALSLSEEKNGHFHLAVHIADVSHYVKEDSPLDVEAKKRSNSTYFPGECVPMLPEALSNHLCSLKEKVIRLTITVLMEFDPSGTLLKSEIVRGFIKSQKRLTYKEAKDILDGKKKSPHLAALKRMEKLCLLLKNKRFERGSVDLALPEVVIQIDKKGNPTGYELVDYDITHQLVEEFMLKANEVVAETFMKRGDQAIFRIHESPGEENFSDFFALARSLGFSLPSPVEPKDIQNIFEQAKQTPYGEQLSIAYIRSMKLAIYSKDNIGHYGLALENYCHFTSPIRRYSDLIVHRRLFEKSEEDLTEIAKHCSDQERVSFKAEMAVLLMKKLRLLELYLNADPAR
ncbi:MAG: VacB/RNase II family 3'-5' exoribonuclease, partial [Chlamydiia bacterium]|nr:VacB/RNase II family 3'-5' exoribonuclease [Chlamydiia bacterium]